MKDKVLNALIYIFTLGTLIFILLFQNELSKAVFISGIGSTIVGLLVIIRKNNYGFLIFSVGFALLLSSLFYKTKILDMSECVTFMICASIFLLMTITLIMGIIRDININRKYDLIVEAKVCDLVKNPNTKKEYYQIMYEYFVDDKLYNVGTPYYIDKMIPKIGDSINLRINSDDYMDVYFKKKIINVLYDLGLILGLMIVTLVIIVTLFI